MTFTWAVLDDYQHVALPLMGDSPNGIRFEVFDNLLSHPEGVVSRLVNFQIRSTAS